MSFSLAALLNFYHGKVLANGDYEGERQGQPYPIRDNADILEVMNNAWKHHGENLDKLVCQILANTHLWGEDLTKVAGLAEQTTASLEKIKASGVRSPCRVCCKHLFQSGCTSLPDIALKMASNIFITNKLRFSAIFALSQ